jgi:hypothetical protein
MKKHLPENFGLGRRHHKDERDKQFLIKAILPKKITLTSRYWYANGWWGDQGNTSQCVGYSWAHWLEDGPVTQPGVSPIVQPSGIYSLAQKVDEWPGEDYEGTSVRAAAKVLTTLGFIGEYRWAFDLNTLSNAILSEGPVVVGTNWYENMFYPNSKGIVSIGGSIAGGHAYLVNGVDTKAKYYRIKNSWGRSWANKGMAKISFADMERLIGEDGEVCLAREIKSKT